MFTKTECETKAELIAEKSKLVERELVKKNKRS